MGTGQLMVPVTSKWDVLGHRAGLLLSSALRRAPCHRSNVPPDTSPREAFRFAHSLTHVILRGYPAGNPLYLHLRS